MLVVLRESVWNASEESGYTLNVSTAHFAIPRSHGDISSRTFNLTPRRVQFSTVDDVDVNPNSSRLSPADPQGRHRVSSTRLETGDMQSDEKLAQL